MPSPSSLSLAAMLLLLLAGPVLAQDHEHRPSPNEKLGTVSFTTSCSAAAQPLFNRAVALLHSFEFGQAIEGFNATLQSDPSCAMAEWGIALSRWGNPFGVGIRPPAPLQQGRDAVNRAKAIGPKTERERAYLDAVSQLYVSFETIDQRTRMLAYRDAMAKVAAANPNDTEASIFYALSLAAAAPPTDKTYADLLKAGAILEKLDRQPAGSSGPVALHHPQLRRSAARGSGARSRPALREDRAVGAARAPHAVAHVHPRRLLAGIDRREHRIGRGRETRRVDR